MSDQEKIYSRIQRGVLWGDSKETAIQHLEVCGVVGEEAEVLYQRALQERIATIRRACLGPALIGLLMLCLGAGLFSLFWYGFGGITRLAFVISLTLALIGAWKLINGVLGILFASKKEGSVAPDL